MTDQKADQKAGPVIQRLDTTDANFAEDMNRLLALPEESHTEIRTQVRAILDAVRLNGDAEVLALSNRFDHLNATSIADLEVSKADMSDALSRVDPLVVEALEESISRVKLYHEQQLAAFGGGGEWQYTDDQGNLLGQIVRGMERVGVYAPGGKACYPSTIIMTVIPAKVAGVEEVILTVPTPLNEVSDVLLAAAYLCGVDRMFRVGGAQAIAALAYGTESIPRVDKIVGPGNIYVATAKEMVFGQVGIDMIAGPSEVVIVADGQAEVDWLVMDMFAQAEHDEMAQSILISTSSSLLERVAVRLPEMLAGMTRKEIIGQALADRGALILVKDQKDAQDVVNRIAPEHLELALDDPESFVPGVRHAGAIFVGAYTAEVVGDYTAGPSHVLPTSGTARFASPLGVYDFQVRSSLVQCSRAGSVKLSRAAAILAEQEGLEAHGKSAQYRVQG
ncbi:MAG: histidinol dehydrogenase [Candidatus Azotimanducaceae bacterium]|jgi:histidinol dehydrogenase